MKRSIALFTAALFVSAQAVSGPYVRQSESAVFADDFQVNLPAETSTGFSAKSSETIAVEYDGTVYHGTDSATEAAFTSFGSDATVAFEGFATLEERLENEIEEKVFGIWKRKEVTNNTAFPFRTTGRLDRGCTATMIGPRHALTAGHCVYDLKTKKWNQQLNLSPGQSGSSKPYGTFTWKRVLSTKAWTDDGKIEWDIALITYHDAIGDKTGWMAYGYKDSLGSGATININGYPADKPFGTMWNVSCPLESSTNGDKLFYRCDTFGGNSGSAVYWYDGQDKRVIYGVHHGGDTSSNYAARINKAKFDRIGKWISENP